MKTGTLLLLLLAVTSLFLSSIEGQQYQGRWKLLKRSIGISAMHMQLLPNDKIIAFDRTNFGPSNLSLPQGKCPTESQTTDCFAHSVEFDPFNRNIRPLTILTDTWCSSGGLSQDGVLLQSGGYRFGERVVRTFKPCESCDWTEDPKGLISPRWYASNQVLPDGRFIIVGGRYQYNYEFIPKTSSSDQTLYQLPFLKETRYSPLIPNNLYPFLHLSPDGNLFIFANDRAVLLDYAKNKVVRNYPVMPGNVSRNYPSTGSSVLLPLVLVSNYSTNPDAEVLICGGTSPDSNQKADAGQYVDASKSCGRLVITSANPSWEMEEMPKNRVMGDMIMLPTGEVLIINGAAKGTAGWNAAREPVLNPILYRPDVEKNSNTSRFEIMSPSPIPRLYHSAAHLLSDGRVLVGGSNPNRNYNFTTVYPTELSLEAFYPPYLSSNIPRPNITAIKPGGNLDYKQKFSMEFQLKNQEDPRNICITMVAPSFTTHSFAMNQRLLVLGLDNNGTKKVASGKYVVNVNAPGTAALAPPGYYQLFVVHEGVPSRGIWVHIK
ncbi:aldehyde oxidase GLOX1 [Ricinus communis]|uniref:Galactose oxidase, putative n=1 Tax=Ricinus communis TaxID=3988 RepID=B9RYU4_RICCO|nr:aldehyde oxidase GLOX1 [Ricinus communis]EEF43446.1 Galactose oxidase precursor, putative [Ricinus communis]|eukprot:XP_002518913.1 aldehyde oxidase GLOX1 [Ricinus communis]